MISDCEQRRSSIKSLRSASLVSSLFESATSVVHPLEPSVEAVEFDSLGATELSHAYRSSTSTSSTTYYTANTPTAADTSGTSEEHKRR